MTTLVKHTPLALFFLCVVKTLIVGARPNDALLLTVIGAVIGIQSFLEYKREQVAFNQELADIKSNIKFLTQETESLKSHVSALKIGGMTRNGR